MNTFRTFATVEDPNRLVLADVPFPAGQRVEVIVVGTTRAERLQKLRELFRATQQLPQARVVSEEEIRAEIAACRNGQ